MSNNFSLDTWRPISSGILSCESSPTYQKVITVHACSPRGNSKSYFHYLQFDLFNISMEVEQLFTEKLIVYTKHEFIKICHKTRFSLK